MDEVHYLADRFRGAVWEEVIIHLPSRCAGVAVGDGANAEEFGEWLETVARETTTSRRGAPSRCRSSSTCMGGRRLLDLFAPVTSTPVAGSSRRGTPVNDELSASPRRLGAGREKDSPPQAGRLPSPRQPGPGAATSPAGVGSQPVDVVDAWTRVGLLRRSSSSSAGPAATRP
jgi:ATP-dependent RNA helicase HelY